MKPYLFILILAGMAGCARPVAPTGGPKDTTPPQVVPEKSTPNLSTLFTGREFQLTFDEWVVLQDVGAQVLVSPPLAKRPEITLKGRTVTFKFDKEETLRPNTTYTVNFGTAVKDLHESIPAKDLRFVFSTGDTIDSLTVSGSAVDAFSGDPLENMTIMLYDQADDSVIARERPYYMARTNKSGQFAIPNVRAGAFKCVAIDDVNQNLKWDGPAERIGFPDSLVQVGDSTRGIPTLRVFAPPPPLRLLTQNANRFGLIKLGFSAAPDTLELQPDLPGIRWLRDRDQDTVLIWYDRPDSVAWNLIAGPDTVRVKALSRNAFLAGHRLVFGDEQTGPAPAGRRRSNQPDETTPPKTARQVRVIPVKPGLPAELPFNTPIVRIDTSLCRVEVDSAFIRTFDLKPDTSRQRILLLNLPDEEGKKYELTLLPGAITDFYGISNADTLARAFAVPEQKQLGTLNLNLGSLKPGTAYVLRLMNGNNLEQERVFTAEEPEQRFSFPQLQPTTYTAQLIEDTNGNRRWDPGDYFQHRQAEVVFSKKMEALRANWELEANLDATVGRGRRE